MATQILVIDESLKWLKHIKDLLTENDYEVSFCQKLSEAKDILKSKNIESIILSMGCRDQSPIDFIYHVRTTYPFLDLIATLPNKKIMNSDVISLEDFLNLGVGDILVKPFGHEKILRIIKNFKTSYNKNLFPDKNTKGQKFEGEIFDQISLANFSRGKSGSIYNYFIKLSTGRYLKIVNKGDNISSEAVKRYQDKTIESLFCLKKDKANYKEICQIINKKYAEYYEDNQAKNVLKAKEVIDHIITDIYSNGLKQENITTSKGVCENIYRFIHKDKDLRSVLDVLDNMDPKALTHSFLVTFLANLLSSQFDWNSKMTTETISMAAMFHDIGKSKLPVELQQKNAILMTPEEQEIYKMHPTYGAEMIAEHSSMNQSVSQIVAQHHECHDGTGFPNGIKGNKLLIFSSIVNFADSIANLMVNKNISSLDALKLLLTDPVAMPKIDSEILINFCKVCTGNTDFVNRLLRKYAN